MLPRPIAWVSTVSPDGIGNIAPVSFFTVVGRKPPILSISLQPRSDGVTLKDTFVNIRDTGEFVINTATLPHADALHRSAQEFASTIDEFDELDLRKSPSETVAAPRIEGCPISFECVLDRIIEMPLNDHVVWGEVTCIHVRDDLYLTRGRIDVAALASFGRLAAEYTLVDSIFTTPLDETILDERAATRVRRLDNHDTHYSPIDTDAWHPSGSVQADPK
ncbi:flavin reductase family protein [Mycolicibacterium sp. 018/SC-01/001]|uniref:flavin reductase family protein n=1 Tax=Mycolicibacterium sp. 018/SC-01/001 TaxID=2592069 RepID=UPI002102841D|nr:flavin reductase family protein [Mycolicibacterium sp. 018/SC-01/001]